MLKTASFWLGGLSCLMLTLGLAFGIRMLEWPCWQNPEFRLGNEMLLATHDAYHWLAGAEGYGRAVGHPMSVMLRTMADMANVTPAAAAFWFPAILASLVAAIVFIWSWAFGCMIPGVAAGLIASIAPGFLGRTLLGYYDTDLVTLFFPLLMALAPACWAMRFMLLPGMAFKRLSRNFGMPARFRRWLPSYGVKKSKRGMAPFAVALPLGNPLRLPWLAALALSGIISCWTQEWHSVFPYLIRYNVALLVCMAFLMAPKGRRGVLSLGSLAYAMPALGGSPGLLFPLLLVPLSFRGAHSWRNFFTRPAVLLILWLVAACLFMRGEIFNSLANHLNAYLKHAGDSHSSGGVELIFPSVAQSIIEVQDLSFAALFPYFHPWLEAAIVGFAGFVIVIFKRPGALFLLPLAALGLLSSRLGGRMVMFGAPVVAIGFALPCCWLLRHFCGSFKARMSDIFSRNAGLVASESAQTRKGNAFVDCFCCLLLCGLLVAPFLDMVPAMSQGPIINRRHAAALAQARVITPPDAMLWLWWDWGYAAHYFARRATIADGAQHGGPSLYLPAAVFATDNARFARQVIRYTASHGNEPGKFFSGMKADAAQELVNRLRSPETPLVEASGRQFVIVSFEMLKLGFWISNFGNWNFVTCQGEGGALSIVPQALSYRLKSGQVRLADSQSIIFPSSINVFDETGVTCRNYVAEWFDEHPRATPAEQQAWLETRRNVNFLFNRVTDEKLAMDQGIYNSLMVQLLLCDPHDPRFSPYFKLVYDNVFARIYEILPAGE